MNESTTPLSRPSLVYMHVAPNGKAYIGWTSTTMEDRWAGHRAAAQGGAKGKFHASIRKYGAEAFTSTVLRTFNTWEAGLTFEKVAIEAFDTLKRGLNSHVGGRGGHGGEEWGEKHKAATADNPEWREKNAVANRRKAQDPEWREKNAEAMRRLALDPKWREKNAEAARRLALDPEWRAANAEANRRLALDPDWIATMQSPDYRAKNAESKGSIPAASPETLYYLRSFFQSASKTWGKRELFTRATLRVPGVPCWQLAQVANEAGIVVSKDNVNANRVRYIQELLPQIVIAEDQSPEAFVARVLELQSQGSSRARSVWRTALEMPDAAVATKSFSTRALAAGFNPKGFAYEVGLARTLARIIREEAASSDQAA